MLESVFFSPRSYDRRSMRWRPRVKLLSLRLPDDEEPQPAVGWGLAQEGGGKHFAFDQSQQLDSSSFLGPPNFVHPQVGWKPKLGQVFHQLRQVSAAAPRPNSDTRRDGSQTEQPWGLEGGLAPSRPVSRSLRASQRQTARCFSRDVFRAMFLGVYSNGGHCFILVAISQEDHFFIWWREVFLDFLSTVLCGKSILGDHHLPKFMMLAGFKGPFCSHLPIAGDLNASIRKIVRSGA